MNFLQGSVASFLWKSVKNEADSEIKLPWTSDAQGPVETLLRVLRPP